MEENKETTPVETKTEPEATKTETSVEELIKSFDEKLNKMQEENNKKLAEKDEIIKQLILQKNKGENEELTEDEQSIQKITQNINKRR